jgi:hypothetical protein
MKHQQGAKPTAASAPTRSLHPIEPSFNKLARLPETPEELLKAVAFMERTTVLQPHPKTGTTQKQTYATPWPGFSSVQDARHRLNHFEKTYQGGSVVWLPIKQ